MAQRTEEPQKAHPIGEFVIVAKFGGHVLHNCKCDQAGRQTKNLALAIKKKNLYLSFYNCCTVLWV